MQRGLGYYLLIILLVLMLFGVVSLADVFNLVFVIIGVLLLLVVGGVVAFRIYVARLRKRVERGESGARTFFWTNRTGSGRGSSAGSARRPSGTGHEGEVKITVTSPQRRKKVNEKVGDYVDFEDVSPEDVRGDR